MDICSFLMLLSLEKDLSPEQLVTINFFLYLLYLFIFILHSRESELYRYILDGTSALAWELPFIEVSGRPVFYIKAEASR